MANRGIFESEPAKLAGEGEKLISETGEKAQQLLSRAAEFAETTVEKGIPHLTREIKTHVDSAVQSTTGFVKKYPIQAVLAGFGVGYVLGFLIKKSNRYRQQEG